MEGLVDRWTKCVGVGMDGWKMGSVGMDGRWLWLDG